MLILRNAQTTLGIYGLGLIGSAVRTALNDLDHWHETQIPITWAAPQKSLAQSVAALEQSALTSKRTIIVWSAGVCGFGASEQQTQLELHSFHTLLDQFSSAGMAASSDFHLVSSAGALFEGQICINNKNVPASYRPYAALKLAQEASLATRASADKLHIYRPSSVYGRIHPKHRLGLVATLVKNTYERRVTHLVGRTHSLRDYVWADDIGRFVARQAYFAMPSDATPHILAQGKPSSVFEIHRTVELVTGRRTYISFDLNGDNDRHTTFGPSVMPDTWCPQTIAFGVRAIVEDFKSRRLMH